MPMPVPRSLFEMNLGGDDAMQPSFMDALAQNRASLVGLGLGLASGGFQGALQGYGQGAQTDALAAYRRAQQQQHKEDLAARQKQQALEFGFRKSEAERQAGQWQQTFNRSGESEFDKMQRDLAKYRGTPQEEAIRQFYANKLEPPKIEWQEDADGNKVPYLVNPRSPTAPVTLAPGFAAPVAPATTMTGPGGKQIDIPADLRGKERAKFKQDIAGAAADAAAGKMTESQAISAQYAGQMEIANRQLQNNRDKLGLDPQGRLLESVPFGVGRYGQSNEYLNYGTARDNFINALLRRKSGATIRDEEFLREERNYFPQPGEKQDQIETKRELRDEAVKQMMAGAGSSYKSPAVSDRATAPDATAGRAPRAGPAATPVRVNSPEEARKLKSGTRIILPDGSLGRVP